MLNFGFSGVPIYNISLDVKNVEKERKILIKRKIKDQEEQAEKPEKQVQPKQPKQQKQPEKPKRRKGRPTKKEEEERRNQLTKEQIKQEDEEKERKRKYREEQKKIKAEEMKKEIERRKKLTYEERQHEEEERQEEEKRKQREREERKKPKYELIEEVITEEILKLFITDFSYCLKKGPTFLTPFNQPTKMYMSVNEKEVKEPPCAKDEIYKYPAQILPETENIQWRFRTEPDHKRIRLKKLPKFPFQYFTNPDKKISTNSTRERNILKYLEQENKKSKEWIKDKNQELKLTREERIKLRKDLNTKIKENLKDTETIALYEERKNTIDEVFHCFSNPEEIVNVLNENEYIHIFAFKSYPTCTRIAYKIQDDIKVCFANPLIEHMLNGLRDSCFNLLPEEETKYKPEYPVYFMPYASLKAKGKDGNDLKIIDEIDGKEVKNFNETLEKYYEDWEELQRLEKLKTPKILEVFEEKVKPTATVKLEPGEYTADKYLKRIFRGKE